MELKYKLAKSTISNGDIDSLIQWLSTYPRLTQDTLVKEFEYMWSKWIDVKYSVFCNSGSSANLLAINALKLKLNDNLNVVVPSVGWVTTVAPFMQLGFNPVMCGADADNFGLNTLQLEDLIKLHSPSIVSLVQVLGIANNMDEIYRLQNKYGFFIMEDACAALGSSCKNKKIGSFGDISTFSLYFGHQLSTIEGGMVCTNNEDLYHLLLMLRSHGWGKDLPSEKYNELMKKYNIDNFHKPFTFFIPGYNLRGTDLQAYIGIKQLENAEFVSKRRDENHRYYYEKLKNNFELQNISNSMIVSSISVGAIAKSPDARKKIVENLDKNLIETRIFSAGNLGRHPFWMEKYGMFSDEIADKIHSRGFFLPNYPELTEYDIDFICNVTNSQI